MATSAPARAHRADRAHQEWPDLTRIAVVGTSGSGKTTTARALCALLDSPHIELDALYWGPGWTPAPTDVFRERTRVSVATGRWVCDGNYSAVRDMVWRRATTLVWLNFGFPRVFTRALRRTLTRAITGEELYAGNRESLRQAFDPEWIPWWVIRTYRRRRREYREMLREPAYAHLDVAELRAPDELEILMRAVRSRVGAGGG